MENDNVLFVRSEKGHGEAEYSNTDDMWDDTALNEAYDGAMIVAKNIVENRINASSDSKNASSSESYSSVLHHSKFNPKRLQSKKENVYSVGDPCRCMFSSDGKIYEANVIEMCETGSCIVRYVGYENEEEVDIGDLRPSCGQGARDEQEKDARLEKTDASPRDEDEYVNERTSNRNPSRSSKSPRHNMDWEGADHRHNPRADAEFFRHASRSMPQMTVPPPPPLNMLPSGGCPSDEADALSAMLMSWYMSGFHTGYYQGMKHADNQSKSRHFPPRRN